MISCHSLCVLGEDEEEEKDKGEVHCCSCCPHCVEMGMRRWVMAMTMALICCLCLHGEGMWRNKARVRHY